MGRLVKQVARSGQADSVITLTKYDVESNRVRYAEDSASYDARGKMYVAGDSTVYSPLGVLKYSGRGAVIEAYEPDPLGNNYRSDVSGPDLPAEQPKYASFWAGSGVLNKEWHLDGTHTDTTFYVYHGLTGVLISIDRWKNADAFPGQNRWEHRITHNYYDGQAQLDSTSFLVDTVPLSNGHQFTDYLAIEQYRYDALDRRVWMRNIRGANCIRQDKSSGCRNNLRRTIWDGDQILYEIQVLGDSSSSFLESDGYSVAPYYGTVAYTYGLGIDAPLAIYKNNGGLAIPQQDLSNRFIDGTCTCGSPGIYWPEADGSSYSILGMQPDGPPSWYGSIIEGQQDASGFQYKRNRYYDPQAGRFTQEDPIGLAGGLNVYGFANGDPVNYSDPFGLCVEDLCAGEIALATVAVEEAPAAIHAGGLLLAEIGHEATAVAGLGSEILSRLGVHKESVARLGRMAAQAESVLGIHGVSVTAGSPTGPASSAPRSSVEQHFKVHDTPSSKDENHKTIELPKPVTKAVADLFNRVFGRTQ